MIPSVNRDYFALVMEAANTSETSVRLHDAATTQKTAIFNVENVRN
jgi:hypothetical protein